MLRNGKWIANWQPVQNKDADGRFVRQVSTFRDWVTADGGPGPDGQAGYKAESGRYHLYVAYICPWATRALVARSLKGLEGHISLSVMEPVLTDQGWRFGGFPGATGADPHLGATYMHEIYSHADPAVNGRATVPVLWDKKRQTIVNNESEDILRIFNSGFGGLAERELDLFPEDLRPDILSLNARIYEALNNGVYRAGFASSQLAYEEAVGGIFAVLDELEKRLSNGRTYLLGERLTEADIRLFVTLVRFDAAYVGLFKCNLKRIADYPGLSAYLRRLLSMEAYRKATNLTHIKAGYYSIKALNPAGIVPAGPELPFAKLLENGGVR